MRVVVSPRTLLRLQLPPRNRRANARAAVRGGLAAVAIASAGLLLAVDTVRARWRDPEFFHRHKLLAQAVRWNQQQPTPRPVVAVIGSSRPQMGFSPDHAADGYGPGAPLIVSLCQSGCQPAGERLNVRRLLAAGSRPDYLLIEVMPSGLVESDKPDPLDELMPAAQLSRADLLCVQPYLSNPTWAWAEWLGFQSAPWYTHRLNILAHQGLEGWSPASKQQHFLWKEMRPNGWSPYYPPDWTPAETARRREIALGWFRKKLGTFRISPRAAAAHHDLLADCREHGVKAALFLMPESPAFRTLYAADAVQQLADYLSRLSAEFGVPVFDGSGWEADEAAYLDGYHLLGPGAEAFSRRFGREALRRWVPPAGQ